MSPKIVDFFNDLHPRTARANPLSRRLAKDSGLSSHLRRPAHTNQVRPGALSTRQWRCNQAWVDRSTRIPWRAATGESASRLLRRIDVLQGVVDSSLDGIRGTNVERSVRGRIACVRHRYQASPAPARPPISAKSLPSPPRSTLADDRRPQRQLSTKSCGQAHPSRGPSECGALLCREGVAHAPVADSQFQALPADGTLV